MLRNNGQISKMLYINAKSIIDHQRGSWEEQWISNETWNLIDNGKKIKFQRNQALLVDKAVEIWRQYNALNKAVNNNCNQDKKLFLEMMLEHFIKLWDILQGPDPILPFQ